MPRDVAARRGQVQRNGDALVLRGAVYAAISIGDSGHGVMETVGVFGEENMEKPWLKYLEIGSLTLNNDDFSLQRNGHFATKVIGKRCENQRRSGDSNRRDVDYQQTSGFKATLGLHDFTWRNFFDEIYQFFIVAL